MAIAAPPRAVLALALCSRRTRLGVEAIRALAEGDAGKLAGVKEGKLTRTPLDEVAGVTKGIDVELLETARMLAR